MPLFSLLLILGLLLADPAADGLPWAGEIGPAPRRLAVILAVKLLLIAAAWLAARRAARRLDTQPDLAIRRFGRWRRGLRITLLLAFGLDLSLGWLGMVRAGVGDLILLDEIVALLPTLGVAMIDWWLEYPIDRRFREAVLIRHLDEGRAVIPIWSRSQFVAQQARHQLALGLVPGGLFLTWWDIAGRLWPGDGGPRVGDVDPQTIAAVLGAAFIAAVTPPLLCMVWDTQPLPDGPLRRQLETLCGQVHVRVRRILLWRTFGSLANAAVVGPWRPLRYILLSDALLDALEPTQIEAAMAHELAHVRHQHIPWMMLMLFALAASLGWLMEHLFLAAYDPGWTVEWPIGIAAAALWIMGFGLISRRLESQADAFAVAHLSTAWVDSSSQAVHPSSPTEQPATPPRISEAAVAAMARTLRVVAQLNGMDPNRRDFRHGSINARIAAMHNLVNRPVTRLPIDRTVRRLKLLSLAVTVLLIAAVAAGA